MDAHEIEASHPLALEVLLHSAASGNIEVVQNLINQGLSIESHDKPYLMTSLSWAVFHGHFELARYLLDRGANIEHQNWSESTPLCCVTNLIHIQMIQGFEQVKEERYQNIDMSPSLANAQEMAQLLLDRGANLEHENENGFTILLMEAAEPRDDNLEMVRFLLDRGANENHKSRQGTTVVHNDAAFAGALEMLKLFWNRGASILDPNNDGTTPLHYASGRGHVEVAKFLLDQGANLERQTYGAKRTPIFLAVLEGHLEMVQFLVDRGANMDHMDKGKVTPFFLAIQRGRFEIVRFLVGCGENIEKELPSLPGCGLTPLHYAVNEASEVHLDIIRFLVDQGAIIDKQTIMGQTPLHLAAEEGNFEIARFLLDQGAGTERTRGSQ